MANQHTSISLKESFASHEKSKCWHPTKNGDLTPRDVSLGSGKKCWFKCDKCPHDFEKVLNKITNGQWCPYCSEPCKKLCNDPNCTICLDKSFESHEKSKCWHPTKNGDSTPRDVPLGSGKKCWFKCDKCPHNFEKVLSSVTKSGRWCPYCPNQKLCDDNNCTICLDKSFESHEKSKCWHPTKNGDLTPRDILQGSDKKYWFKCDKCPHDFEACLFSIKKGRWCPYCAVPCQKLCDDNNCTICLDKSFESHEKSKCWHPTKNGDLTPRDILQGSDKKYWFKCDKCPHDFEACLFSIKKGRWCPYCAVPCQKLCDDNNCTICLDKSFESHEKSKCWHPTKNGDLTPRDILQGSDIKCWFNCDKCSEPFPARMANISRLGRWCPICKNKTEQKLFEFLKSEYPDMVEYQIKYDWCKNLKTNCHLPFDFVIFEKIIIELDGDQHIDTQIRNWKSPEEQQERDMYKMEQAINNGKHVIRILQRDVWNDNNDWKEKLIQAILELKDDMGTAIKCIGDCDIYREYEIKYRGESSI